MGARFTKESFDTFVKRMKAVEDRIKKVPLEDVQALGDASVNFLQAIFPKRDKRQRFKPGAHKLSADTTTPLWTGWRTYQTSTSGNVGFLIKHARMGQNRVSTVLAALDQGSKAHNIRLSQAQAFRFQDAKGAIAIRASTKGLFKTIRIPRRKPQPGPMGYIKPTYEYIQAQMNALRLEVEEQVERHYNRGDLIGQIALKKRIEKLASQ